MRVIPYFKFPVQIIILDDEELFFDSIGRYLICNDKHCIMTTNVDDALKKALSAPSICADKAHFLYDINLNDIDDREHQNATAISYARIIDLVYNEKRFAENAVFVVDYAMPLMNGIKFFQKIKHVLAKKVLITGYDEKANAINAFNSGLIDKYLTKEITCIKNELNDIIDQAVLEYFCSFSEKLFPLTSIHRNNKFIQIFSEWQSQNKIIEYYQCDEIGSYLGLDAKGNIFWLVLRSEQQNSEYIDAALGYNLDPNIMRDIAESRIILFFLSEEEKKCLAADVSEYFFDTTGSFAIDGDKFYYAYAENKYLSIDKKRIVPFVTAIDL